MISNAKAQASKLFSGIKNAPIAKGVKGVFHQDGLIGNSQTHVASKMNAKSLNSINLKTKASLDEVGGIGGMAPKELIDGGAKNMATIDKMARNGTLKGILEKNNIQLPQNTKASATYREAMINEAKDQLALSNPMSEDAIKEVLSQSTTKVNGKASLMSPVNAAMEYYGSPIGKAIGGIKAGDYVGAIGQVGVTGARVGATGLAIGGAGVVAKGTTNAVRTGIDRMRGNEYER